MNRNTLFTLRVTGIVVLGALAASVLPAKSDAGSNNDYLYQYFESNGAKIRYAEHGAGEPLVLIPALGGTVQDWIDAGAFTLPYHALAVDGRASNPGQNVSAGSGLDAHAAGEGVIRLLDLLRIPRAHVAGYASGAEVAAYLSKAHPDRLLTASAGDVPPALLPQLGAVQILAADPAGTQPEPQFMRSLALFLHAHPTRHSLWESPGGPGGVR